MATCYQSLTVAECNQLLSACKGLKITHVWRSVSPCIFLEIGRLAKVHRHHHPVGQVSVMVETDWRVEKPRSVEVGSGFSSTRIDKRLPTLVSAMVNSIEVTGRLPELAIGLDDGRRFVTFTTWMSQPRWAIGFRDLRLLPLDPGWQGIDVSPWIHVRAGRTEIEYCYDHTKASVRKAVKRMGFE
jgi:hypothetical protein